MKHLFKPAVIKSVIYVLFLLLAVKIFWFVIELAFLPVEDIEYTKRAGTKSLYYRTRFASQKKAGKVFRKKEPVSDIRNIRLLAIYHSPRQVVITVSKKGKTSVLVRGDQIDGYVLDDATATEAIFVKNGKKYRIRLYEPKGAGKARQSVRFVPSGGPKASGTSSGGIKEEGGRVVVEKNLLHHYTKHMDDIWKNIGLMGLLLFIAFYLFGHLPDALFLEMGVTPNAGVKIAMLMLLLPLLSFVFTPFMSAVSRHNEYAADEFGSQMGGKENLVSALMKLVTENKSFPKSHPLVIFFYYTHPPVLERLKELGFDASNTIVGEERIEEPALPNDGIFAYMDKDDH